MPILNTAERATLLRYPMKRSESMTLMHSKRKRATLDDTHRQRASQNL